MYATIVIMSFADIFADESKNLSKSNPASVTAVSLIYLIIRSCIFKL